MARLVTSGFESGAAASEGEGLTVTGTVSTSAPRTGAYGVRTNGLNQYAQWAITGATQRDYFLRSYIRKSGNPATANFVLGLRNGSSVEIATFLMDTTGALKVRNSAGTDVYTSPALTDNVWYRLELRIKVGTTTGNGTIEARIDGATVYSAVGTADAGTAAPTQFMTGQWSGALTATVDCDDVALNDDQAPSGGSGQVYWAGPGAIRNLVMSGDTAHGNWTKPGGATSNLFSSADNVPPVGIADSTNAADAEKMLRNASTGASNNLDTTQVSYSVGGVPATDALAVVQPLANVGSGSATDTAGQLSMIANPVSASVTSFAAFDNGVAGTFPTNWQTIRGIAMCNPVSINRASSAEVRLQKTTNTNRAVLVDYIAVVVDSRPGVSLLPTRGVARHPILRR